MMTQPPDENSQRVYTKKLVSNPDDIVLAGRCHPEYEWHAKSLIESHLNFLPNEPIFLPYLPMLQSIIASYKNDLIPEIEFAHSTYRICRQIRNEFLDQFEDVHKLVYDEKDFAQYETYLPHYLIAARERLCSIMESEPDLQLSLYAELMIRELMREETYYTGMESTPVDNAAVNVVWYRTALLENGSHEEAQESALYGDELLRSVGKAAYTFLRKK